MSDSTPLSREDLSFAELAISQGIATRPQVDECLALLRRLSESGVTPLPRLGELLVQRGYIQSGSVDKTIKVAEATSAASTRAGAPEPELPGEVTPAAQDPANLYGKYVRTVKLGAGGMGEVWKAWDRDLRRWAALKFLKVQDPEELARFKREAQTAGKLSHPNIAAIYDVGEAQGRPYIAMQYVEGQTLQTFPRDDVRRLVEAARQTALAIHYAHEEGVIHRDLKPANLMVVTRDGRASSTRRALKGAVAGLQLYVMDFGLAKSMNVEASLSVSGSIVGTPLYMSPEQAAGSRHVDARTDVYSLGATLYELLVDRPPFKDVNAYAILKKVIEEEPRPLRRIRPRLDADLETIVLKCLEKDPARRYGTALELAEDLTRYLEGEAIQAHPASVFYRLRKQVARRKAAAGLLLLAGALGASFGGYWILWGREHRARSEEKRFEDEVFGPIFKRLEGLPSEPEAWKRGVELLESGLGRFDRSWQAWMKKGELLESLERAEEALRAYARALEINPRLGSAHYRRGRLRMDVLKDPEAARRDFEQAETVEPGNEFALVARARVAVLQNDYGRALSLLDQAEPIGKHVADLYYIRAFIHGDLKGDRVDLERSLQNFNEVIRRQPWIPVNYLNRGVVRKARGDSQGAIADYTKALEINPRFGPAYTNRGTVYTSLGDFDRAIADLDRAVALDPSAPEPFINRASARLGAKDLSGVLEDADRAIALNPRMPEAYINRARARKARREFDRAIADFTRALELSPRNEELYVARGECRYATGDAEGALADLAAALAINPASSDAYSTRGVIRQDRGQVDPALSDFEEAIRLAPKPVYFYNRGNGRRQKGDLEAALRDYDEALRLDPRMSDALANRGTVRFVRRDLEGALADLDAAVALDPRHGNALTNRGLVHHTRGELDRAIRDYDEALRVDPRLPDAYAARGGAWQQKGELRRAVADYLKALEVAPPDWPRRAHVEGYLRRVRSQLGE